MALALLVPLEAPADERILGFHADIDVHPDGSMSVTETITVRAEGDSIKRGIYRDLPTTWEDTNGRRTVVAYTDIGVRRDGVFETFHQKPQRNGIRIYIGKESDRFPIFGCSTYSPLYIGVGERDRELF